MSNNTATISLNLDWLESQSITAGQQWILTAMHQHGQSLVALLWRILGNEQDVCDAYQDTFLQLAHCLNGGKPDNIKAYLFRTASNVAISMLRRKKCHQKCFQLLAHSSQRAPNPDYARELDTKNLQQVLRLYITRLPEHLRNAIILRDLAELPYKQAARIMGVSTATARVYRRRAMQLLIAKMTEKEVD